MVSVVIPTYNRANTIEGAIRSVIDQGDIIKEIIIIDDASTDNTKTVIDSINCNRIIYKKLLKSSGACNARNVGIGLSTGEYIAFQDSDDIWKVNKIKEQIEALEENNVDIVCSGYDQHDENNIKYIGKNVKSDNVYIELLKENFIGTPTIFGKSTCFKQNKFDIELPRFQDWDLMIRLSKLYKIYFIDKPLVDAYIQPNSITKSKQSARIAYEIILKKNKDYLQNDKETLELFYRRLGVCSLESGNYTQYFKNAFYENKSIKSTIDYVLSIFGLKKLLKLIHNE